MNKRGAVELSMTTIIVIVIGVTLLSLGLVWIRNTFGGVNELTDKIFAIGLEEINLNYRDPKLTVPTEIKLKPGQTKVLVIYLNNDGSTGSIRIDEDSGSGNLQIKMQGAPIGQAKTVTIPEGEELEIRVGISADKRVTLDSYDYNVVVEDSDGKTYDEKGFFVTVEK
ncbi:hypothetical protein HYX18_01200 [Candidatus Woesearchaeota archaeon]|nr:hypothetical protein [Candidatus Woesearchaeota archaeon]